MFQLQPEQIPAMSLTSMITEAAFPSPKCHSLNSNLNY